MDLRESEPRHVLGDSGLAEACPTYIQMFPVLYCRFSAGATEARRELHWLPIRQHIITFKLATITYKARRSGQPAYLSNSLHEYLPTKNLRSASALLLQQPPVTTVFSSRAFPVAAPSVWNSLNIHTRSAETFLNFKSRLKAELFTASYDT